MARGQVAGEAPSRAHHRAVTLDHSRGISRASRSEGSARKASPPVALSARIWRTRRHYAEGVERTAWTDERLDDLANRMDAGFARLDADMRELRVEIGGLRVTLLRVGGGIMVGLVSVIATILVSPVGG